MVDALSAATLAIYAVLVLPVLYLSVRHGRKGLLGWLFLFLFCTLRIVGSALEIKSSSSVATIISNVGLSPLLFATSGILHEARALFVRNLNQKQEMAGALLFHIFVAAGVALTAAGSAKVQQNQQPDKAEGIMKAGIVILCAAWGGLVGYAGASYTSPVKNGRAARAGKLLLASVCVALVFIGVRMWYSLVALCTQKPYLSPSTGSMPIRVVLAFLPELIAAIIFVVAGFVTQGSSQLADDESDLSEPQKPLPEEI